MNAGTPRRWYHEPLVWLLVALPLVGMLATFALMKAGAGMSFDAMPDEVRRSAQVQQRDLAADERALALGYRSSARLPLDSATLEVALAGLPDGDYVFELVHPLEASRDRRAVGQRDAGVLTVPDFDPAIGWRLRLAPASGEWRLVGRWDPSSLTREADLQPAFAAATEPGR